jgi:FMN phosphatase YigB (HAD superfamily)
MVMAKRTADRGPKRHVVSHPIACIIFDLDGTLYNQTALRRRMVAVMVRTLLRDPRCLREIMIVRWVRAYREELAERSARNAAILQYRAAAERFGRDEEEIEMIVDEWIQRRPLALLPSCRLPAAAQLLISLRQRGIRTAVLSDYPPGAKLHVLGLRVDEAACTTDSFPGTLKPDPSALSLLISRLGFDVAECLYVGDRNDRDGEMARRAGMRFLLAPRGVREPEARIIVDTTAGHER